MNTISAHLAKKTPLYIISLVSIAIILFLWRSNTSLTNQLANTERIKDFAEEKYNYYGVCQSGAMWQSYTDALYHFSISYPLENDLNECVSNNMKNKTFTNIDTQACPVAISRFKQVSSAKQPALEGTRFQLGSEVQIDITTARLEEMRLLFPDPEFKKEEIDLDPRKHIPAEKYISLNYGEKDKPYFKGIVLFEWNARTFQITFTPRLYNDPEKKFASVIDSLTFDSSYYIPAEEYGVGRTYTDPFYGITVSLPNDWYVRRAGDSDGALFALTNQPVVTLWDYNRHDTQRYSYIYIGHGSIFTTAGAGICYNAACETTGTLSTTIERVEYAVDVIEYKLGFGPFENEQRAQFLLENYKPPRNTEGHISSYVYITLRYAQKDLSAIRNILSSISF